MGLGLVFLLAALMQLTLVPYIGSSGYPVDLVLICTAVWSVLRGGREVFLPAFIAGLFLGHFGTLQFGLLPLFYILIAFLASLMTLDRVQGHWIMLLLLGLLMAATWEILTTLAVYFAGLTTPFAQYFWHIIVPRFIVNAALMPLAYGLFRSVYPWFFSPRQEVKT